MDRNTSNKLWLTRRSLVTSLLALEFHIVGQQSTEVAFPSRFSSPMWSRFDRPWLDSVRRRPKIRRYNFPLCTRRTTCQWTLLLQIVQYHTSCYSSSLGFLFCSDYSRKRKMEAVWLFLDVFYSYGGKGRASLIIKVRRNPTSFFFRKPNNTSLILLIRKSLNECMVCNRKTTRMQSFGTLLDFRAYSKRTSFSASSHNARFKLWFSIVMMHFWLVRSRHIQILATVFLRASKIKPIDLIQLVGTNSFQSRWRRT